ncbi:MAG: hypothetical protein BroJett042_19360 [Bacteroidota bacterium]|nr:MAG: hypothetical protein BroJett042_19360 [Bacteroidota bacterium]HNR74941.1 hypothetical protein [Cyclobacteriaceae bacterium]HNU42583.1 hypothetical protein [Cyclobacteriaceae bacterium]
MSTREILTEEIKKTPESILNELYDFLMFLKQKEGKANDKLFTHLASEKVLSRDWESPEDDEAWKNL